MGHKLDSSVSIAPTVVEPAKRFDNFTVENLGRDGVVGTGIGAVLTPPETIGSSE